MPANPRLPIFADRPQDCPGCGVVHVSFRALCDACLQAALEAEAMTEKDGRIRHRKLAWRGVCPPAYRDTDWSLVHPVLSPLSTEWEPNPKRFLILAGKTGVGKTRCAFGILHRMLLTAGRSVHAVHAGDAWDHGRHVQGLSSAARLRYSDDHRIAAAAEDCMRRCKSADILLIDDLGKERTGNDGRVSEAVQEAIFGVVEFRVAHQKPIIVTTNTTETAIERRFSGDKAPPLLRRLRDEAFSPVL